MANDSPQNNPKYLSVCCKRKIAREHHLEESPSKLGRAVALKDVVDTLSELEI